MKTYRTVLNNDGEQLHRLIESDDLVIIRTRDGYDPIELLFQTAVFADLNFSYLDYYPEASVHTIRINNQNPRPIRDLLKNQLRALDSEELVFVGSLFIDEDSGQYQIYTGNFYIQFSNIWTEIQIKEFFHVSGLIEKFKTEFAHNGYFVKFKEDQGRDLFDYTQRLLKRDEVIVCQPELVVKRRSFPLQVQKTAYSEYHEWISERAHIPEAWKYSKGKGISICVIDDGLDFDHPAFLQGKKVKKFKDFFSQKKGSKPTHQYYSEYHGTAVASICCSNDKVAYGVAPEADLMIARVKGIGSMLEAMAFKWAADEGADIINCSWGPYDGRPEVIGDEKQSFPMPDYTRQAINYAFEKGRNEKGCVVIFAAGNGREPIELDTYASFPGVLAIGSSNKYDEPSNYSDYGDKLFCLFPSSDIKLSGKDLITLYGSVVADRLGVEGYSEGDFYNMFGGTSSSAPAVAGITALVLSLRPELNRREVKEVLRRACSLPYHIAQEKHPNYGYGIIDAYAAVIEALDYTIKNPIHKTTKTLTMKNQALSLHIGINNVDNSIYQNRFSPLNGCINDARAMKEIAIHFGYEPKELFDENATHQNVLAEIKSAAEQLKSGDIFLLTYAGHGASIVDKNSDESDGHDESWILYDNIVLDDELYQAYTQFASGVRVLIISDSCHSGTVLRAMKSNNRNFGEHEFAQQQFRVVMSEDIADIYNSQIEKYRSVKSKIKNKTAAASIKLIAACSDVQLAQEMDGRGLFSRTLEEVLSENEYMLSYTELVAILQERMFAQTPQLNHEGQKLPNWDTQMAFSTLIDKISSENPTNNEPLPTNTTDNVAPIKPKQVVADRLLVVPKDNYVELENSTRSDTYNRIVDQELLAVSKTFRSQWDEAYLLFLQHADKLDFVEPEVLFSPFSTETEATRSGGAEFLKLYPAPVEMEGVKHPFVWHLEEKFSQLLLANSEVYPADEPHKPQTEFSDKIKIAQIDTGYIERHPMLPEFLDYTSSRSFIPSESGGSAADENLDNFQEQDGHGNATLALLAGGSITVDTEQLKYSGVYGAIPYARVFSLRISDTVVLLSGKRFAKALDYAVETLAVDVVTMSMAGLPSKRMARAVNRAYLDGVVVVSAGGNSWSQGAMGKLPKNLMYPARFDRVIAATGAAFDEKPYKVEGFRADGGEFMQTCHGPASAMKTAIAAYTPNVTWFGTEDGSFSRKGGGTSSATPQVAAAAAIWLQKYKSIILQQLGNRNEKWRIVEAVRTALFKSAKKVDEYAHIYGNGLLKAHDALKYTPVKADAESPEFFIDIFKLEKSEKASLGFAAFDEIAGMFITRSNTPKLTKEQQQNFNEMLATELNQLAFIDVDILRNIDPAVGLDFANLSEGLTTAIINSEHASNHLKMAMAAFKDAHNTPQIAEDFPQIKLSKIVGRGLDMGLVMRGQNVDYSITEDEEFLDTFDEELSGVPTAAFSIEIKNNKLRNERASELNIYSVVEGVSQVALISEERNGEMVHYWKRLNPVVQGGSRGAGFSAGIELLGTAQMRGGGIKKMFVKIFNLGSKILKNITQNSRSLAIDLKKKNSDWENVNKKELDKLLKKPNLLMLHGTFNSPQGTFMHLMENQDFAKCVIDNYNGIVLAADVPTLTAGVEKNATYVRSRFTAKNQTVIASSRGALVARAAFPLNLDKKQKMVLSAGPHFGTPLMNVAEKMAIVNRLTNLAFLSFGTVGPIIKGLLQVIGLATNKVSKLQGLMDMKEQSNLISKLNKNYDFDDPRLLFFGSDYNPSEKSLKRMFNWMVDNTVFQGRKNDGLVPTLGALGVNKPADLNKKNRYLVPDGDEVSHMEYFKNKAVVERLIKHIK